MAATREEHAFSSREACERLNIEPGNVVGMYLLGSRLWGTSGPDSDFDLFVIVKDKSPVPGGGGTRQCLHAGKFDAVVQTQEVFHARLSGGGFLEQVVWELTPPRSAPGPHCVIAPQRAPPHPASLLGGGRQWKFDAAVMAAKLRKTVARDWRIAEKHMGMGKCAKAKKIVVHALRSALISRQFLARHAAAPDAAVDYSRGLRLWQKMHADYAYASSWSIIDAAFSPLRDKMLAEITAAVATSST